MCNVYYIETVAFKYSDSSNLFPSLYLVFLTNNSFFLQYPYILLKLLSPEQQSTLNEQRRYAL